MLQNPLLKKTFHLPFPNEPQSRPNYNKDKFRFCFLRNYREGSNTQDQILKWTRNPWIMPHQDNTWSQISDIFGKVRKTCVVVSFGKLKNRQETSRRTSLRYTKLKDSGILKLKMRKTIYFNRNPTIPWIIVGSYR